MRHPEFPVVSFLVIPILLVSLPSHIRAGSIATIALISWMTLLNLIRGVNSIIWANNTVIKLEVWCDITTKLLIGFTFAVPLSALCICRHLENVSSNRQAIITRADKRRRMKFESVMCFGVPVVFMALHYVVQGHRYDLIEDVGCYPNTYFSVAGVTIVWVPPLVFSTISFVYAVAAFHHFLKRRIEFAALLRSSNSALSPGRYFRLMALAVVEIIWDSGTNIYILYYNTFTGLRPWISWENVHSNFSRVDTYPNYLIPPSFITQLIVQWWIIPISSIFIFLFFAFGEEAISDYRSVFFWFCKVVLQRNIKSQQPHATAIFPTYNTQSHNVDTTFSGSTSNTSEHEPKDWDDISLKMPEIIEPVFSKVEVGATHLPGYPTNATRAPDSPCISSDRSRRSLSCGSTFSTAVGSVDRSPLSAPDRLSTPAVIITSPERATFSTAELDAPHRPHSPSLSTSQSVDCRRSTSTDPDITISPAFYLSTPTAQDILLHATADSQTISSPHSEFASVHLTNGVRVEVERVVL